jgi:hypothetical protein
MYCDIYRKAGPDIAGKTKFVTGKKKFKRESLVYHNKNLKHKTCLNMVSAKPITQFNIFSLIQDIINYVQINTYWSCIVPIGIFINLARNIILLASKKCFLTSQGLVGACMNCRVLIYEIPVVINHSNMTSFKRFESKPVVKIILIYDRLNL